MPRIDDLIKEKCPEGVTFKPLSEVTNLTAGDRIIKSMMSDDADYPVMGGGDKPTGRYNDFNFEHSVTISRAGSAGSVNWLDSRFWATDVCFVASQKKDGPDIKFVYYYLCSQESVLKTKIYGGNLPKLNKQFLWELPIPLPPLEIQQEIVRMLNSFTELKAELEAELAKRKQQYQHYRDYLLSYENLKKYDKNVELRSLDELGTLSRGRRFVHKDDRDEGIPAIHYGELYTHYGIWADEVKTHIDQEIKTKLRYASNGDVVIVGAGENKEDIGVGVAWLGDYDVAIHDACYFLKHNQNPKFLSYLLRTHRYHQELKKYVSEGKICSVSPDNIGKIKFPIPNLGIQNKIVRILDSFDIVCNDISVGLPAEIEARHKQYEYYRDKLLTFKEAKQ